jgi:hypothetical protein
VARTSPMGRSKVAQALACVRSERFSGAVKMCSVS